MNRLHLNRCCMFAPQQWDLLMWRRGLQIPNYSIGIAKPDERGDPWTGAVRELFGNSEQLRRKNGDIRFLAVPIGIVTTEWDCLMCSQRDAC